jgi:hypothetical protein
MEETSFAFVVVLMYRGVDRGADRGNVETVTWW